MATISSSQIIEDMRQVDGRRWILERHIDNASVERLFRYLALVGDDAAALLSAHAARIATELSDIEIAVNIAAVTTVGSLASPTFVYSTASDNIAALREAYRNATRVEAVMIGDYLSSLTNNQLQTAFGLTAGQVTTLRTNKLTPAATLATQIRAAAGQ